MAAFGHHAGHAGGHREGEVGPLRNCCAPSGVVSGVSAIRLAAAVLALAALVFAAGGCSRGAKPPGTPSPSATATATAAKLAPSPTPTATATAIGGVQDLSLGDGVPIPAGVVFYVEGGCSFCDGPATSLDRVYRDQAGVLHVDRLFERKLPTFTDAHGHRVTLEDHYITSIAVSDDGYTILIGVCNPGAYCGGVGEVQEGASVTFYLSSDGGVTWNDTGTVSGGAWALASPGGHIGGLVRHVYRLPGKEWEWELLTWPSKARPQLAEAFDPRTAQVFAFGRAPLLLGEENRLEWLAGGNNPFLWPKLPAGAALRAALPGGEGLLALVAWDQEPGGEAPPGSYLGVMQEREEEPEAVLRFPAGVGFHGWFGGWAGRSAVVNVTVPGSVAGLSAGYEAVFLPALVDLQAGVIHPIAEYFADRAAKSDRGRVLAVGKGPVLKVQGTGDCLNVRERLTVTAPSMGCYRDGVLLVDEVQTQVAEGLTWVRVGRPEGGHGWASADFLDKAGRNMSVRPVGYPAGTLTGNADVDPVIAAIASGKRERITAVTHFSAVPCTTTQQGIGSPPLCPEGVSEGTPVDALPTSSCEGGYWPRAHYEAEHELGGWSGDEIYAVLRVPRSADPAPAYAIIFNFRTPGGSTWGRSLMVVGGKITAIVGGCADLPERMATRFGPAATYILPPR